MIKATKNGGRSPRKDRTVPSPFQLTALLYLQQAILSERYEMCREIIDAAEDIGVPEFDIHDVLESPTRDLADTS